MTEATHAVVDDHTYDVTSSVLIRAHRSAVGKAITAPELFIEWFGKGDSELDGLVAYREKQDSV